MTAYRIVFPRFGEDVLSKKRTLVHVPASPDVPNIWPGDRLLIVMNERDTAGVAGEVIGVSMVKLVESPSPLLGRIAAMGFDDMVRLNLMPGEWASAVVAYRQRWDATNPDALWASNPTVWRIVFRYLDDSTPPEFVLAS
jgi:hypothetical protein